MDWSEFSERSRFYAATAPLGDIISENFIDIISENFYNKISEKNDSRKSGKSSNQNMASPAEKLANSLKALESLQRQGRNVIRSKDVGRIDRERLVKNGFLQEVMKGWYIPARPDEATGETTAWYASFWGFCVEYLGERFGRQWCLSPEQSAILHAGNWTVPGQLLVRAKGGRNKPTRLLHGTSVLDTNQAPPVADDTTMLEGLRVYNQAVALVGCSPNFFIHWPIEARTLLAMQRDPSAILARLLAGNHTVVAARLAGAFRNIGYGRFADEILAAMRAAGHTMRETDPFQQRTAPIEFRREPSPYLHRIRLLWEKMRQDIPANFPAPAPRNDIEAYLAAVDGIYNTDAYNSLSIEGYRVTPALIERIRGGQWNPDANEADRQQRDTLAARGYWQAFNVVKQSVRRVLTGENPGTVAEEDHSAWYRALFAPSVASGLLQAADLAGYRNGPVYIRLSKHVPLNANAVPDAMPAFFELLRDEPDPAVRVVLGHFIFVYIHPYYDGNGRIGRFLMNTMMAAGGYPWTVIPMSARDQYMAALEAASVDQNIVPFAEFLAQQIRHPVS